MKATTDGAGQKQEDRSPIELCRDQTRRALRVCDHLEALADALPRQSVSEWREAQHQCGFVLRPYFDVVNDVVLSRMLSQSVGSADRQDVLTRLKSDCSDQTHALADLEDLILDALSSEKYADEPEALGYALRGHFEALRRDLRWQDDVLWPLAARILLVEDAHRILQAFQPLKTTR